MTVKQIIEELNKKGINVDKQSIYDLVYGASKKVKSKTKLKDRRLKQKTLLFSIKSILVNDLDYISTLISSNRRLIIHPSGLEKLIKHFQTQ